MNDDLTALYAGAFKKTLADAVAFAIKTATRHAQKLTATRTGIPKFYRKFTIRKRTGKIQFSAPIVGAGKSTPAAARRQHREFLKYWILALGFRRVGGMDSGKTSFAKLCRNNTPVSARQAYYEPAPDRQGELAAGWNSGILASGGKPVAEYISRHGKKHGEFSQEIKRTSATATATFHEKRGTFGGVHGHLEIFAKAGIRRAETAMKNAIERKLSADCARLARKKVAQ